MTPPLPRPPEPLEGTRKDFTDSEGYWGRTGHGGDTAPGHRGTRRRAAVGWRQAGEPANTVPLCELREQRWLPRAAGTKCRKLGACTTEMYFLTVPEEGSLGSRCQQGHAPSEGSGKGGALGLTSRCWCSQARDTLTPLPHDSPLVCMCVQRSLFYKGYQSYWIRAPHSSTASS